MSQKSSLPQSLRTVQLVLTGNTRLTSSALDWTEKPAWWYVPIVKGDETLRVLFTPGWKGFQVKREECES